MKRPTPHGAHLRQNRRAGCDDGRMTSRSLNFKQNRLQVLNKHTLTAMFFAATITSNITSAHAQAGADCVAGGNVQQTNACAIKDFQQADTDHQILYGDVMRALSAHERPALRKEQSDWTRSRTTQCKKAQAAFEAQADWPRRFHECLSQQIKARDGVLKQWLHHGAPQ